jgi:hypothetical protein
LNAAVPVHSPKVAALRIVRLWSTTTVNHSHNKQTNNRKEQPMKTTNKMLIAALALGVSAWVTTAQDQGGPPQPGNRPPRGEGGGPGGPGGPGGFGGERGGPGGPGGQRGGPGGGQRFTPPIIAALDANGDGVIDEKEIANASAALKKLDKDGDGKLSREEYMGVRPGGFGGPGGPGGQGGPGMRGPGGEGRRGGPGGPGGPGGEERPQRPPLEQ